VTDRAHQQRGYRIRFDWGLSGAEALLDAGDVDAVVVDVLSFTTTVGVAVERGIEVYPFPWKDERAQTFADGLGATLAVGRLDAQREGVPGVSLSPAAMSRVEGVKRIVLPSPNGSTIADRVDEDGVRVVAASLCNASAVAGWLARRAETIAIVAAGERWPDGSLRPCAEDLWGAGAVVDALISAGRDGLSAEATVAAAGFLMAKQAPDDHLAGCASGRELIAKGFAEDVRLAGRLDASAVVPVLTVDGGFRASD